MHQYTPLRLILQSSFSFDLVADAIEVKTPATLVIYRGLLTGIVEWPLKSSGYLVPVLFLQQKNDAEGFHYNQHHPRSHW